ncbi:hypothetical protein QFC21_005758 [Naganishia friedmannii]|uniref:Uncharacterized protein n=1 Tax=Naganishia friedmannii TaxID=89922 RepID=A0ACC2V7X8_9TREE|nr:hypothetical protein QFC21_005758 [Naganishia friedmannii]
MAVKAPLEMSSSSATKRRAEDELQSERTQFRKMVEGALLEREEDDVTRLVQDPQLSLPAPSVDYVPSGDQGISFSVDTLNALLPNMDGYHQGFDDPLQALLQGADLGILENFLLYHPQSSF